jgi:hypothetical protein
MLASLDRRSQVAVAVIVIGCVIAASAGGYTLFRNLQPTTIRFNLKDGQAEVPLDQSLVFTSTRPIPLNEVKSGLRISTGPSSAPGLPASAADTSGGAAPTPRTQVAAGVAAEGQLVASPDGRRFSWTPTNHYLDLTRYTVRLAPKHDAGGHTVKSGQWKFSTTLVPRILAVTTDSGVTIGENTEIGINSQLKLNFNATMDQPSVKILLNNQPAQLAWEPDGRTAGLSIKGLAVGALDMTLGPGGKDTSGHPMPTRWDLKASIVFRPNITTIPLQYPAIVQIPNDSYGARDQSGLSAADFVFEYVTEGGITRLSAVFSRAPVEVGPIRSARLISMKLTRHYRGQLFLSGGSQGTIGRLNAEPVPAKFEGDPAYFRSNSRPAPNNLYLTGSGMQRAQSGPGSNDQIIKGSLTNFDGAPAASFGVPEHDSTYSFDPTTGTYTKVEEGRLMSEAIIGQPVHIQMVVVMHAGVAVTNIIEDLNGARGLDFDMESGGGAEFYFMGKKATGKWAAADRSSGFTFTYDDGRPLTIPRGVVWVDVIG